MDSPLVSVVLPFYNAEKNLGEVIRSVLAQDYRNLELILVNDASTDESLHIAERYDRQDSRVRIISHQSNQGCGPGRNTGVENVRGKYLFFMDSDDILCQGALKVLIATALKENVDLVIGSCDQIDEQGIVSDHDRDMDHDREEAFGVFDGEEAVRRWLRIDDMFLPVRTWGILINTELYRRSGLFFIPGDHEDLTWTPFLYKAAGKVIYIRDIVVTYRIRTGSVINSPRTIKRINGYAQVWKTVLARIQLLELEKFTREFKVFFIGNLIWILSRCPQDREVLKIATGFIRNEMSLASETERVEDSRNLSYLLDQSLYTLSMSGEEKNYDFWRDICYGLGDDILHKFIVKKLKRIRHLLLKSRINGSRDRGDLLDLMAVLDETENGSRARVPARLKTENDRLRERMMELSFCMIALLEEIEKRVTDLTVSSLGSNQSGSKKTCFSELQLLFRRLPLVRNFTEGRIIRELRDSGHFSPEFYLGAYGDLDGYQGDLLRHFVRYGGREGRSPNPYFNSRWYLNSNLSVKRKGINPLYHYLTVGAGEGLWPSPDYGPSEYEGFFGRRGRSLL